jgi:hypothetical protein
LVRPASSMPLPRLRRTTSSPAAGLPVVAFFTVPVRFCAEAGTGKAARVNSRKSPSRRGNWFRGWVWGGRGSFDFAGASLREAPAALRMTNLWGALETTELWGALETTELWGALETTELLGALGTTELLGALRMTELWGAWMGFMISLFWVRRIRVGRSLP